jgi:neutral trehalase
MTTTLLTVGVMSFLMSCGFQGHKIATNQKGSSGNELEALSTELAKGWNTWNTQSVLSHVLLPAGLAINLQLQEGQTGDILEDSLIGRSEFDSMEHVTPGPHAYDGSYTELELEWRDIHVRVQSAAVENELYLLVTPIKSSPGDALIIDPQMMWGREGEIEIHQDAFTGKTSTTMIEVAVRADRVAQTSDQIKVSLTSAVSLSTDATMSIEKIAELIEGKRLGFFRKKSTFGSSSELFDAMQTVLAWNVVYEPTHDRVITPVSRVWSVGWKGWILFEWDTYFAAYMHSLNNKELAYSNALAMTNELTDRGFVPNFASSVTRSEDRSQPPVGSFVVKEIYRKYREDWFVREVFDELLIWNRWWAENRDFDGYLTWGSDPYEHGELAEWLEKGIGTKKGAKWESGLDNSPMFDDAVFDAASHRLMLADVGLMSLYILDCQSLSELAGVLGKNEVQAELVERARTYSEKLETLWNEEFGLYLNKDLVTGEFSYRLSPTLFYPLLAKVPDQHQATRMMKEHFNNPEEFWGEYMMPSIARNDAAFADNTYWRGRIWAPMNFLVYLGIRNYDLPEARRDLVEKSSSLLLKSWIAERHVYENYNSETGQGNDAGMSDKFYHWGALLGFIGLIEEGHIASPLFPLDKACQDNE